MYNVVRYWKDPIFRMKNKEMSVEHPSGDVMEELDNQEMLMIAGAGTLVGCILTITYFYDEPTHRDQGR